MDIISSYSGRSPDKNRGKHSSGSCDLQTFLEGFRVHCAGAKAPKSTNPEGIPQSAGAGVWGATSRRQFKLSGRQKNGYYFKFIRAVAQLGSALVSGTRGPGFKSRRPDELNTVKPLLADGFREVRD